MGICDELDLENDESIKKEYRRLKEKNIAPSEEYEDWDEVLRDYKNRVKDSDSEPDRTFRQFL